MQILHYWKIIPEILILWYAIYMTLLFVKGTRSEQLLKGLLIIVVIYIVTRQLGLEVVNWTITGLFPISVIALVVIFQPELRRALAQLGQFGISQENAGVIDEITRAAVSLSGKKTGALIVMEREAGLKSYAESGTPIDAAVTSYLIDSIFLTQSPLHDGAVMIQRGRLAAAGCVLPLPEEEKGFPRSLGMRHRAALGISAETDAVCVVVSEETGAISVADGGKLTRGLDEASLEKTLKGMISHPDKKPHFHINKNTGLKVTALILAVAFWFYIVAELHRGTDEERQLLKKVLAQEGIAAREPAVK